MNFKIEKMKNIFIILILSLLLVSCEEETRGKFAPVKTIEFSNTSINKSTFVEFEDNLHIRFCNSPILKIGDVYESVFYDGRLRGIIDSNGKEFAVGR